MYVEEMFIIICYSLCVYVHIWSIPYLLLEIKQLKKLRKDFNLCLKSVDQLDFWILVASNMEVKKHNKKKGFIMLQQGLEECSEGVCWLVFVTFLFM